jgi:class 3 adenylate cyclase
VARLSVSRSETSPSLAAIVEEVGSDLPVCREKTSPDGMLTVAFTDIEGSTEMMERMGEDRWVDVMFHHNRITRDCVDDHGGEVIKSRGDGFMIAFASASSALDCAVDLQRTLSRYSAPDPAGPLRIRVGLHTGNIFHLDDDFLGKAVVLAARITGHARGGEILVSAACREYTQSVGRWRYGQAMELRPKGLAGVEQVYSLHWKAGDEAQADD